MYLIQSCYRPSALDIRFECVRSSGEGLVLARPQRRLEARVNAFLDTLRVANIHDLALSSLLDS